MTDKTTIIYTLTDEAPALATYSLLPVITGLYRLLEVSTWKPAISPWPDEY